MATRMQQRRGTASQWTTANPILNAGEIGFESDNNKFKIGDGVNHWDDLTYFVDGAELTNIIDGAPALLDTLNELAAAIGDDPAFMTTVATNLSNHSSDTTGVHGITDTAELATKAFAAELLTNATKTNVTITGDKNGLTITAENGVADSTTDNLTEGSTNKYFTDERAQDAVGNALGHGLKYTDSSGAIEPDLSLSGGLYIDNSDKLAVDGYYVTFNGAEQTLTNKTLTSPKINEDVALTATATELNLLDGVTGTLVTTTGTQTLSGIKTFSGEYPAVNQTIVVNPNGTNSRTTSNWTHIYGAVDKGAGSLIMHLPLSTNVPGYVSGYVTPETEQLTGATLVISGSGSSDFYGTYTVDTAFRALDRHIVIYTTNPSLVSGPAPSQNYTLTFTKAATPITANTSEIIASSNPNYTNEYLSLQASSILPVQPGNAEKFLMTSGLATSWQTLDLSSKASLSGATFTGAINISDTTESTTTGTGSLVAGGGLGVAGDAYIGGDLTISGDFTVSGTTTTVNTTNLNVTDAMIYIGDGNSANLLDLGIVSAFDDGTYQHTGLVRDASAGAWKLFKGVTDEPTTTVNFAQGSLDDLQVGGLKVSSITTGDAGTAVTSTLSSSSVSISPESFKNLVGFSSVSGSFVQIAGDSGWDNVSNTSAAQYYVGKTLVISGGSVGQANGEWTILEASVGPAEYGTQLGLDLGNTFPQVSDSNSGATYYVKSASTLKTISSAELGYLDGVTSAIQDQLDDKAPLASPTFTGTVDFTGATVNGISSYEAPTLGSTSIGSGATVTTIAGLTLDDLTLTGSLTANSSAGTSGQVLASTGTGVEWITPAQGAAFSELMLIGA